MLLGGCRAVSNLPVGLSLAVGLGWVGLVVFGNSYWLLQLVLDGVCTRCVYMNWDWFGRISEFNLRFPAFRVG